MGLHNRGDIHIQRFSKTRIDPNVCQKARPDVNWDVLHVCQGCSHSATHHPILCQKPEFASNFTNWVSRIAFRFKEVDENFHKKIKNLQNSFWSQLLRINTKTPYYVKHGLSLSDNMISLLINCLLVPGVLQGDILCHPVFHRVLKLLEVHLHHR